MNDETACSCIDHNYLHDDEMQILLYTNAITEKYESICDYLKTISADIYDVKFINNKHHDGYNPDYFNEPCEFGDNIHLLCPNLISIKLYRVDLFRVDLTSCENLTSIEIILTNITEINLKNCINLERIRLSDNKLSAIDLSDCAKLKSLNIDENKLKILDISKNELLTDISAYNNKITHFIPNSKIRSLNISYNKLKELDLSGCAEICELIVNNNNIENIVVDSHITDLNLYHNNISSINKILELSNLTRLNIRKNPCKFIFDDITTHLKNLTFLSFDICQSNLTAKLMLSYNGAKLHDDHYIYDNDVSADSCDENSDADSADNSANNSDNDSADE